METLTKRLVKVTISLGLAAVDGVVAVVARRGRANRWSGVVVLYHGIEPTDRLRFETQLERMSTLGRVVAIDDVVAEPDGLWRMAITFDDALASFAHHAVPALQRRDLPSALFVPSGLVGQRAPWENGPSEPLLGADDLRGLGDAVTVGSHARTHRRLSRLDTLEVIEEVTGSRDDIRRLYQHRPIAVEHFAYPFGDRSPAADAAVIAAGYRCSWSVEPVPVRPSDAPHFGRVGVEPSDWALEHHLKLIGAYRWMGWLMASRRRRNNRRPNAR